MHLPDIIPQIQVTLECNFNCDYCFQHHQNGFIRLSAVEAILEKTVAHNTQGRSLRGNLPILVIWHGGEPLMAGLDFYEQVVKIESRFRGIRFQNRVQTNGALMTKAYAQFFVDHNFHIGFSLDGPGDIHNRHRRFKGAGTGTFDAVMKGIDCFTQIADPDRLPVIAVITRDSIGREKELFEFFKGIRAQVQLDIYDLRCRDMQLPHKKDGELMKLAPSPDEIGEFMIRLFDLWFHDSTGRVDFNELRTEVRMILQPELDLGDPFHKKRCDPGRLIFDPHGRVFSCDQYVNDALTCLGHIQKDSIKHILDRKIQLWEEIKLHLRCSGYTMACGSCEWGRQHMGGCLTCMKYNALVLAARTKGLSHWTDAALPPPLDNISGETYYCQGLRTFRDHVRKVIEQELVNE